MSKNEGKPKVFKDPVHGNIRLPAYCVAVIDTPDFNRLKQIKQLGMADNVYPGATHTRFVHSCGVCYIAGKAIDSLQENQPHLNITPREDKCVRLAGLCHDLGHGPFSHLFEHVVKKLLPDEKWKHEKASEDMVRTICKKTKLEEDDDIDVDLICDLIRGAPPEGASKERWDHYRDRHFLYQIVANKDSGIDVDKWDYFARDCKSTGLTNSFDHDRIIPFMRVCDCSRRIENEEGELIEVAKIKEICFEKKLLRDLNSMFMVRWDLHDRAYQHRVVKLIEAMVSDVLHEYFSKVKKEDMPEFDTIKDTIADMDIYGKLDDRIIGIIERSKNKALKDAQEIWERIQKRELYQCIGEIQDADSKKVPSKDILEGWLLQVEALIPYYKDGKPDVVILDHVYDYGMKAENPLLHVHFCKEGKDEGFLLTEDEMPPTLPRKIQVRDVRLYSRTKIPKRQLQSIKESVTEKILELAKLPAFKTPVIKDGTPNQTRNRKNHTGYNKKRKGPTAYGDTKRVRKNLAKSTPLKSTVSH